MSKFAGIGPKITIVSITGLMAIPVISVLLAFFPQSAPGAWQRLWETTLPDYLINTATLMGLVASMSLTIGVGAAWLIAATEFPGRKLFSWMLVLPLAAPAYIIAYLYTDLLEVFGPIQVLLRNMTGMSVGQYWFPDIRNVFGAAVMLSIVLYPYIYLLARASFRYQSADQWHASRSLGASPGKAFMRVALPAARPAIAGGLALVLMETLADFGVADYFAIPTFSTGIFRNWLALGDRAIALKLAAIMLLVVFLLVLLEWSSRRGQSITKGVSFEHSNRMTLRGWYAAGAFLFCALPILFGFLVPLVVLALMTLQNGDNSLPAEFIEMVGNSISLAGITAALAVFLAIFLAYAYRESRVGIFQKVNIRLATLGYALPGALLAVGLLAPIGTLDRSLTGFLRDTIGWNGGLVLTGTIIVLCYALVTRFLTVAFNSITGGFEKIPLSMDHAAGSLGANAFSIIRRIHLPLLSPSIVAGAMLVFIDVLRELPATLILRPFNFETLATRVYRLASDERLAEASTSALIIILVGIIPVILLNRIGKEA